MAASHGDEQTTAEIMRERGEEVTISVLKECFRKVDANGDNLISFREFCLAIEELGIQWELDTAKTAFKTMDENGSKTLDWYEFSHGIHLVNPSVKAFWNNIFNPKADEIEAEEEQSSFTVDEMQENLNGGRKVDWKLRNKTLTYLQEYVTDLSDEAFRDLMEKLQEGLAINVQTRQSAVAREACLVVAFMCKTRGAAMLPYISTINPGIWGALRMKIQVINESGKNAGRAVARFVPDNDEHELLNSIIQGTGEKHSSVRARNFEYLEVMMDQPWAQTRLNCEPEYWQKFKEVLKKGTGDKDAEARKASFSCILHLKDVGMEDKFSELEGELSSSGKRAMKRAEKALKKKT